MKQKYVRISAFPTPRQKKALDRQAKKESRKPAELVREALENYLFPNIQTNV